MKHKWIARTLMFFGLTFLSVIPWGNSMEHPVQPVQDACAGDGSCCRSVDAICGLNGINYPRYEYRPGSCGGAILI